MDQNERKKAEHMQESLTKLSSSFCTVKWRHATLNLGSGTSKSCCHLPFRSIEQSDVLPQIHDTRTDQKERSQMMKGERPESCSYCWWMEDQGQLSDRILWSSKSWMSPHLPESLEQVTPYAESPSWVELNFSNICNLKCSYCSPLFSTKWESEILEHGAYPTHPTFNHLESLKSYGYVKRFDNTQLMEQFWPWFNRAYAGIHLLKITGGEPFLSPHTFKLIDWVINHPNPQLNLSINSNLTIQESIWEKFVLATHEMQQKKSVGKFYLHPSIDSFGDQAEYIRHGLDISVFKKNVREYLMRGSGDLVFICTLNNLSLGGIQKFWEYLFELKQEFGSQKWISVTTEILMGPDWQNINILPSSYEKYLVDTIEFVKSNCQNTGQTFSTFEVQGLERALEMMRTSSKDLKSAKKNFYRFFSEHDRRRSTDFQKTFPEMKLFWDDCRSLASGWFN